MRDEDRSDDNKCKGGQGNTLSSTLSAPLLSTPRNKLPGKALGPACSPRMFSSYSEQDGTEQLGIRATGLFLRALGTTVPPWTRVPAALCLDIPICEMG